MIKGVRIGGNGKTLSYLDTLVVPIIENTPHEEDLRESMVAAMEQYPDAAAILVRRHGVYVWGELKITNSPYLSPAKDLTTSGLLGNSWESAKTQTEVRFKPVVSTYLFFD